MKHLLDYKILKEWGFIWAEKDDNGVCTGYLKQDTSDTDMFGLMPIFLSVYCHPNLNMIWIMSVLSDDGDVLFHGKINNKDLNSILKACLIWKFNE